MKALAVTMVAMAVTFGVVLTAGGMIGRPTGAAPATPTPAPTPPAPAEVAYRQLLARLVEYDQLYAVHWWPHSSPADVERELDRQGPAADAWLREYYRSPGGRLYFVWTNDRKRFLAAPRNRILADYLDWLSARGQARQPNTAIPRDVDTLADFLYPYADSQEAMVPLQSPAERLIVSP